jgi:chromosome segregation ATPase
MTPGPDNYRGAVSLAGSKYASPQRRAQFEAFPLAISLPAAANGTIATKEQIAAASNGSTSTDLASYNSDAQLAMAQNEALKEQVDEHSASFVKSVSSAVNNTRHLLTLIRESIKKDSPTAASDLATVDNIWKELEQLFEAAKEAKNALPTFLEKQKNNMSLYHNSVLNETMRESQAELDLQHKKVNLQHSLILEHQQAFQEYKATTDPKLGQRTALEEQVSRMTLDKGLVKQQFAELQQELERFRISKVEDNKKSEDLQKEVNSLLATKNSLSTEASTMRKALSELQDKVKIEQQQATDRHEKEVRQKTEQIVREEQKVASLQKLITELKGGNLDTQKVLNQQTKAKKALQEKFDNLSREHAEAFNVSFLDPIPSFRQHTDNG